MAYNLTCLTAIAYSTKEEKDINDALHMASTYLERNLISTELFEKIVNSLNSLREGAKK
jgi:mevalonate kinase